MRIIKLILPIFLIFALALPSYGLYLPENKVVDREMIVEEDENIVDNSINGVPNERPTKSFTMSSGVFFIKIILPFLALFSLGPIYLLIERKIKTHRKSHSN